MQKWWQMLERVATGKLSVPLELHQAIKVGVAKLGGQPRPPVVFKELFFVAFRDSRQGDRGGLVFQSFRKTLRAVRRVYPTVDFSEGWRDLAPSEGWRCSYLTFDRRWERLGILYHVW
jgi:hypothetical protein